MGSLKVEGRIHSNTNQMGSSYQQWLVHLDLEQLLVGELARSTDSEAWKWATTSPEKPLGLGVVAAHKYWRSHGHDSWPNIIKVKLLSFFYIYFLTETKYWKANNLIFKDIKHFPHISYFLFLKVEKSKILYKKYKKIMFWKNYCLAFPGDGML